MEFDNDKVGEYYIVAVTGRLNLVPASVIDEEKNMLTEIQGRCLEGSGSFLLGRIWSVRI